MQRNENSMFEVGRPFYDGLKPFGEREDVDSARRGLAEALARARERIDELLGPRQWTWIDSPAEKAGPCHVGDDRGGIDFSRQGMTMGVPRSAFGELVDVVREEVGPLGFTETVDISVDETGEVNLFNVDDGGYVGIVLSGGTRAFSMRYTTGCRPFPKDAPAANVGRAEAEASCAWKRWGRCGRRRRPQFGAAGRRGLAAWERRVVRTEHWGVEDRTAQRGCLAGRETHVHVERSQCD